MYKPKVSIVIPAYNEEANIKNVLERLLKQDTSNLELVEILVGSDGSTDNTVEQVKSINNPILRVIDFKTRIGKTKRINTLCLESKGEIIVICDADIIPTDSTTISTLVQTFIQNPDIAYASGALVPTKPQTFIEEAFIVSRSVWDKLRKVLKDGESVYTCHGALYALKADFAKLNPYPDNLWTDIGFYYLTCIKQNMKYKSVKNACVYFKLPSTAKDYLKQVKRYHREGISIREYFGSWVDNEYYIPKTLLYKYKLIALVKYPLHCAVIFILNFYSKYLAGFAENEATQKWSMVNSTKVLLKND